MNSYIRPLFVFALLLLAFVSTQAQTLENQFQEILDSAYQENPDAVGVIIHVEAPDKNISWTGAVGYPDKKTKAPLEKDQPALIASNTKTYVAVAILKLVEKGNIKLDQPIADLISEKSDTVLTEDGYVLDKITIRHLLSHTSGIADYVDDAYFEFVNKNPNHQWNRDEQIQRTVAVGEPLAEPGKQFKYGDINYLLLTEIIEGQTEKPFYTAIAELIDYKKHGLNTTWFFQLEEAPENVLPLTHQYWSKYDWDSNYINPSWDLFGGGGIISTAEELALFFQLLFEGKIIEDKELLAEMYSYVLPKEESNYCLGIRVISFHGHTAYYHGGFWGTDVMYLPGFNTTISAFTLQKDERDINAEISNKILELLKQ